MFDLLSAIDLTAGSALVVLILAIAFGNTTRQRVGIGLLLGAWFVLVVVLAATRLLYFEQGAGTPGLGLAVVAPIVVLSTLALRAGSLDRTRLAAWVPALIGVNAVRVLGITFVILYSDGRLPAPFAPIAGWGDILVGLAALPVALMAARNEARARLAVLVWNTLGLADLVTAVGLGVTSSPGPLRLFGAGPGAAIMSTLPWLLIPGFLVPLLASTHLAIFYRLLRSGIRSGRAQPGLAQ